MIKFVLVSALCQLTLGGSMYGAKEDADWGEICLSGTQQSPVILDGVPEANKKAKNAEALTADYPEVTDAVFYNNGHGFQVESKAGNLGTVKYNDKTYNAIQYHFHFPSEHATADGKLATGEVHVVHQAENTAAEGNGLSDLLVIGRFLDSTANTESAWLKEIGWSAVATLKARTTKGTTKAATCLASSTGTKSDCATRIETAKTEAACDTEKDASECVFTAADKKIVTNAAQSQTDITSVSTSDFIKLDSGKVDGNYWRYEGSLTTPTCDETVHWFVLEDPEPISKAQAEAFTDALHEDTNRPLQDIVCNAKGVKELYWNTLNVPRLPVPSTPVVIGSCKPKVAATATETVVTGKCEDTAGVAVEGAPAGGWTKEACLTTPTNKFTPDVVDETGTETSGASQAGFSVLLLAVLTLF